MTQESGVDIVLSSTLFIFTSFLAMLAYRATYAPFFVKAMKAGEQEGGVSFDTEMEKIRDARTSDFDPSELKQMGPPGVLMFVSIFVLCYGGLWVCIFLLVK